MTTTPLRFAQRHAALFYLPAVAPVIALILSPGFAQPVLTAVWAIAQGAAIVWIGSGAWEIRERWAVRLQVAFVAIAIIALIAAQQDASVAGAGLFIFLGALLLLHSAHILIQYLDIVQAQLVSVAAFARTESVRQSLFYTTFAGPLLLTLAPNVLGASILFASSAAIAVATGKRARTRLTVGLARELEDTDG